MLDGGVVVTAAAAVAVLSALVLVHEAGHLLAARLLGLHVATFSLGFGPRLLGLRAGGVDWRISLFPFGGYVSLAGGSAGSARQRPFASAPPAHRAAVALAGPLASALLTFGVLAALALVAGGASAPAALRTALGTVSAGIGAIAGALFQLATGALGANDLAGPVAIAKLIADAAEAGGAQLALVTAFLSLNLAVLNLLPVPGLDGGQLLFIGLEAARGRPLGTATARWISRAAMAALCLGTAALVYHDLLRMLTY